MPWSTEHAVRVARVLQRMALICRQQPQLVSPIIKVGSPPYMALHSIQINNRNWAEIDPTKRMGTELN